MFGRTGCEDDFDPRSRGKERSQDLPRDSSDIVQLATYLRFERGRVEKCLGNVFVVELEVVSGLANL